nr:MAG TPA: TFIIB Transcription factor zinc-finger [Caudoviricetes sp.]
MVENGNLTERERQQFLVVSALSSVHPQGMAVGRATHEATPICHRCNGTWTDRRLRV